LGKMILEKARHNIVFHDIEERPCQLEGVAGNPIGKASRKMLIWRDALMNFVEALRRSRIDYKEKKKWYQERGTKRGVGRLDPNSFGAELKRAGA